MKIEWNKKYNTISVYILIVLILGIAIFQFFENIPYFRGIFSTFIGLLAPFFLGFVFAYIFHPILNWFERKVLPFITRYRLSRRTYRTIGILFTLVFGISIIVIFFSFIIPELFKSVNGIISQIAALAPNIERFLIDLFTRLHMEEALYPAIEYIIDSIQQFIGNMFGWISKSLSTIIDATISTTINITTTIINILVGIVIAIYLWAAKEKFFAQGKKIGYAFFKEKTVNSTIELLHEVNRIFSRFISGKIVDSAIIGVLCYIGMLIFGIQFPLLISVIVGVTNVIPYFGPFIGAIPSILLLLMVDPVDALAFAIFILILQQIDGNFIGPKILGDSTGLPAFWVVFAVTVFGGLFGFLGMLFGVPLFAVIYMLIRRIVNRRLEKKNLSVQTSDYASDENTLIIKGEKLRKPTAYKK